MKRALLISSLIALVLVAGVVGAWFAIDAMYTEAEMSIQVRKETFMTRNPEWTTTREDYRDYIHTQVAMLTSEYIIGKTLNVPEVSQLPIVQSHDNPEQWLEKALAVENEDYSELITVKLRIRSDGDTAESILNALARVYITDVLNEEMFRRSERRRRVAARLKSVTEEIHQARRKRESLTPHVRRRETHIMLAENKVLELLMAIKRESNPAWKKQLQEEVELLEEMVLSTRVDNSAVVEAAILDRAIAIKEIQQQTLTLQLEQYDLWMMSGHDIRVLGEARVKDEEDSRDMARQL